MYTLDKRLSMRKIRARTRPHDLGQRRPFDEAFSCENRASHPRLERHNQKGCNHCNGEQGGLDGMRKIHDTNVAVVLTRFGPYPQTYSQWVGGPIARITFTKLTRMSFQKNSRLA